MADQGSRQGLVSSDEWSWYDRSKLAFWLRYDTWPVELGLCLICDIDPEKSEDLNIENIVDYVNIMPDQKFSHRVFKSVCLLSEDPIYKLEPMKDPVTWNFDHAKQYLKEVADWQDRDDIKPEYIDICDRLRLREATCKKHGECWALFESNPEHLDQETFAPSYFIDWAISKGIAIPWIDWAMEHHLVNESTTETSADNDAPKRDKPKDKRLAEGLKAAKTILDQEHIRGKLRNWRDFKTCMKKAVVIKFIRRNPADFPHCDKIDSRLDGNKRRTIKDQEPTLTKDFPNFTEHPDILAEYEKLTGEK